MKIILLLISSFAFIAAKSQDGNGKINNNEFDRNFLAKNPGPSPQFSNMTFPPATYKLLFETEKGKVYESPVDKMKCLAADFPSKMPVARMLKTLPEKIPNPMLKDPTIPKPLKP